MKRKWIVFLFFCFFFVCFARELFTLSLFSCARASLLDFAFFSYVVVFFAETIWICSCEYVCGKRERARGRERERERARKIFQRHSFLLPSSFCTGGERWNRKEIRVSSVIIAVLLLLQRSKRENSVYLIHRLTYAWPLRRCQRQSQMSRDIDLIIRNGDIHVGSLLATGNQRMSDVRSDYLRVNLLGGFDWRSIERYRYVYISINQSINQFVFFIPLWNKQGKDRCSSVLVI